jgi:hypothetical protein
VSDFFEYAEPAKEQETRARALFREWETSRKRTARRNAWALGWCFVLILVALIAVWGRA